MVARMIDKAQDIYCDMLFSPLSFLAFWSYQGTFMCWLLGHDSHFIHSGSCARCGMGEGYYQANKSFLNRRGLFLAWKYHIIVGKLAELAITIMGRKA